VIRLFKVYYPLRLLVLLVGEALIVWSSFLLATLWRNPDSLLLLNIEDGYLQVLSRLGPRVLAVTIVVLMLSHLFDLYDSASLGARWDHAFRLLLVVGFVALALAVIAKSFPQSLPGNNATFWGIIILTFTLFGWRAIYSWMVQQPFLRERVYILGNGERAERLVHGLRQRTALGLEIVGWSGELGGEVTRDSVASHLQSLTRERGLHRVIVALPDRRKTLPVEALLDLRLLGVKVEDATSWLERISGRIEVEQLNPSWLIFGEGFRFSAFFRFGRRVLNFFVALIGSLLSLPLLPFVVLAIKLDSPGPVLYRQKRVGYRGATFNCYKFRTMRQDAEADTGATWALDSDPRITRVGGFLRTSRLDEIPQLWCVLKGDMHFVGPRPERPEFVEWLSKAIPFYGVRHVVRPGITGWAQVKYKYGNTLEDAREKLQHDLFYIKNRSIGLDLLIMLETIKIVLLGRGAK
jgi:sugar transferase (PEP-CTERM system associated)